MFGIGLSLTTLATGAHTGPQDGAQSALLDFTTGLLPAGISFSRASQASYFSNTGTLVTAAIDQPRFDHHPVNGAPLGLVVEAASTNLLARSNAAIGTGWNEAGTSSTNLALNALAQFSGVSVATLGQRWARLVHSGSVALTAAIPQGVTMFYRPGSSGRVRLVLRALSGEESRIYAPTGSGFTVEATEAGVFDSLEALQLADGQTWRLCFVFTPVITGGLQLGIGPDTATASESILVLGAQIEPLPLSSFIFTAGTAVSRASDLPVLQAWTGQFDVSVTYGDDTSEGFVNQTLAPGYWPAITQTHVKTIRLNPI